MQIVYHLTFFHDGPFWLKIYKNMEELEIKCINDRTIEKMEFTFYCDYYVLLNAVYRAMKKFLKILYKNDMNLGEFASVYQQTLLSINELKVILK